MTYLKKNIILVLVFVFVVFIAYQFSIKQTFELKDEYQNLKNLNSNTTQIKNNIRQLSAHKTYLDSVVKANKITSTNLQNELLITLNRICEINRCKISKFEEPHTFQRDDIDQIYYNFALQGNYEQIVKSIYDLEQGKNLGQIVSVDIKKEINYKLNKTYLEADILIKNTQ